MKIYIKKNLVPEIEAGIIPSDVLRYVIKKAEKAELRYADLYFRYKGKHHISRKEDKDDVKAEANYSKYIVDITKGYFLGEPIKYNSNDIRNADKQKTNDRIGFTATVEAQLDKNTGKLVRFNPENSLGKDIDISKIIDCFHRQNIADIDEENGKNCGIFGEACEILYPSTDEDPIPKSAAYKPNDCILVQDTTVEHNDLFGIRFEKRERLDNSKYYDVTVYTNKFIVGYESSNLSKDEDFIFNITEKPQEHFFGGVPIIVYENNSELQGDFEQVIELIDARNGLLSDRLTDKRKFLNSLLAFYGFTLNDDDIDLVQKEKFLDGIPTDAKIEYIQKVFDESSMKILDDTLISDIHKMTFTCDMSDENFSGNSTGVALKLKLLAMNILVKSKMRMMEKGLKKRWLLYNNWLSKKGISPVSIDDVDIVFTLSMPIDEVNIVNMVCQLKSAGIVDDKTLLSMLWFVKDPDEALENIKKQKEEAQQSFQSSFGKGNDDDKDNRFSDIKEKDEK